MSYRAGALPEVPPEQSVLLDYIQKELSNIESAFNLVSFLRLQKKNAAPPKPRDGDVVYADGTNWDPGAGEGVYGYYAGSWNKL